MIIERRFEKLNPTPEYQREAVWSRKQKQLLIDSIIRNMDIPKLYFRVVAGDYDYEIIDGQQRVRTIWEYRQNHFPLLEEYSPEFGGMYYQDLPEIIKDAIDLYQLQITVIDEATDQEIRDMFCRLQNGTPLNSAEKRNAIPSRIRDFIADLVGNHPVYRAYRWKNRRFSYEQMTAQCLLLELTGAIVDVKSQNLDKMYHREANFNTSGAVVSKMRRVLNYLEKAFREPTPEFKGRAQFVSLYWLVSQTIDRYVMSGREADLRKFYIDFEYRRRDTEDIEMVRYTEALSRTSDGRERIEYRHHILLREWLIYAQDMETKDAQRMFTEEQRLAIFRRDHGICQICGEAVLDYDQDFEADHKIPFTQGGKTTVENGQTTHKQCNRHKGGRIAS
jgi:hypothetical protein